MQTSFNVNNTLSAFASSLNRVYSDNFKNEDGIKRLGKGAFSVVGNTLHYRPDLKEAVPTNNFVAVDRRMGEKYSARLDVKVSALSQVGAKRVSLVTDYHDEKNHVALVYNSNNREAQLIRYQNGNKQILGIKTLETNPGREFSIQVDKNFSKQDFYIEGEKVFSFQDTANGQKNGSFGFGALDSEVSFRNLKIYQ